MKPIILVIVGGAMLMLAIHRKADNTKEALSAHLKEVHLLKTPEKKNDTEIFLHNVSIWIDRFR